MKARPSLRFSTMLTSSPREGGRGSCTTATAPPCGHLRERAFGMHMRGRRVRDVANLQQKRGDAVWIGDWSFPPEQQGLLVLRAAIGSNVLHPATAAPQARRACSSTAHARASIICLAPCRAPALLSMRTHTMSPSPFAWRRSSALQTPVAFFPGASRSPPAPLRRLKPSLARRLLGFLGRHAADHPHARPRNRGPTACPSAQSQCWACAVPDGSDTSRRHLRPQGFEAPAWGRLSKTMPTSVTVKMNLPCAGGNAGQPTFVANVRSRRNFLNEKGCLFQVRVPGPPPSPSPTTFPFFPKA